MSQPRERWLRRLMGLGPAPDRVGLLVVNGRARRLSKAQGEAERAAWHREGWRARLATDLAFLPQRMERRRRRAQARVEALRAERALAASRTLRYCSRHVHPIGRTSDVEGYFDLGRARYRLDILTPGVLASAAEYDWARGEVVEAGETPWFGVDTLLVSAETLDDQLIAEAIGRWYRRRFELERGHWSQLEGRMPTVTVELAWDHPENLDTVVGA